MKYKKILSFFCALMIMLICAFPCTAFADDFDPPVQTDVTDENVTSAGLIMSYSLSISAGTKKIFITATTSATDIMAKVGFTDISIQRSSNGLSGWTEEKPLSDDLANNTVFHSKSNEQRGVAGGYYYRVVLNHYAKETGWFFPSHESIKNYSNVVWVPTS